MVSVDTVYQRVLALANKEQRGYITPQEFNLYANQAQMEIFEQYFYDLNQFKRIPGNDSEYHDMVGLIEEKIYPFKHSSQAGDGLLLTNLSNFYRLGDVYVLQDNFDAFAQTPFDKSIFVEEINKTDLIKTQSSPLTKATQSRPVYYVENNQLYFFPKTPLSGSFELSYISKPKKVNWTYIVIGEKALYNNSATDHQDFELHVSEETKLVTKVLQLAGVGIKDYALAQAATQKEISKIQQEKQ